MSAVRSVAVLVATVAAIAAAMQLGAPPATVIATAGLALAVWLAVARSPSESPGAEAAWAWVTVGAGAVCVAVLLFRHGPPVGAALLVVAVLARQARNGSRAAFTSGALLATVGAGAGLAAGLLRTGAAVPELWAPVGSLVAVAVTILVVPVPSAPERRAAPTAPPPLDTRWFHRLGEATVDAGDSVTLAAGIAHDFNNLLTSILGNAHVALAELHEGSSTRRAVLEIEEAGARAKELVAQLLAYSGTGRLDVQPLDLQHLVRSAVEEARPHSAPDIDLVLQTEPELLTTEGDASHLKQVVVDLLHNALDAMEGVAGTIRVTAGRATLTRAELAPLVLGDRLESGAFVWVQVSDEGTGIDEDVLQRMFFPFFSTRSGGSGLGLSAVYGVVRDHLGAIDVETRAGRGTTVRVYLPAATELQQLRGIPHPGDQRLGAQTGTILVAEDEDLVRRAVTRMLSRLGFDVVATADGHDAIRAFSESPGEFRIAFLDIRMPDIDGFAVLQRLREIRPDIPAILCTGYSGQDERPSVEDVRFLRKPFSLTSLMEAVNAALGPPLDGVPDDAEDPSP